jgi:hypothetical protein
LQKAVDLISLPFTGAGVVWDFDPESRTYTGLNSDQVNQDFTSILLGDVSGNWSPASGPNNQIVSQPNAGLQTLTATLSLPDVTVLPGEYVTVPLNLDLPEGQIYGVDLTIVYDPAVVSVTQVTKGALTTDWSTAVNTETPGEIRVALAGTAPIEMQGELLNVGFNAVSGTGTVSDLILTHGMLNEENIPTILNPGSIRIEGEWDVYLPLVIRARAQ